MREVTFAELAQRFPFLKQATATVQQQLRPYTQLVQVPANTYVCWEGEACTSLTLLLAGTVRVYKVGENGREITLYRVEENQSCILTASCILSHLPFPALAVVETEAQAMMIPAPVVRGWVAEHEIWRTYLFGLLSERLSDVITTVEEVAFRRVDERIAELLIGRASTNAPLAITHQQIAFEIGTAREVVSRILKDFERQGLIAQGRGSITISNRAGLAQKF